MTHIVRLHFLDNSVGLDSPPSSKGTADGGSASSLCHPVNRGNAAPNVLGFAALYLPTF